MKLEYIVVYENSSEDCDIEHCQINFKVTLGLQKLSPLPHYKLSGHITQL